LKITFNFRWIKINQSLRTKYLINQKHEEFSLSWITIFDLTLRIKQTFGSVWSSSLNFLTLITGYSPETWITFGYVQVLFSGTKYDKKIPDVIKTCFILLY